MNGYFVTMSDESIKSHIDRARKKNLIISEVRCSAFPSGYTDVCDISACLLELIDIYESELKSRERARILSHKEVAKRG